MALLSIIIPVYNVEAYVGRTLASVFDTTASVDDFEVIVVNDGTPDNSMDVIRQYADRPNITILEQANQGVSAARMNGLALAKGEYVWFVDSDDWLVEDGVGKVLSLLKERQGVEVLFFPFIVADGGIVQDDRPTPFIDREQTVSGITFIKDLYLLPWEPMHLVIKRSLMNNPWLFFPLGLLHEDVYFGSVLMIFVTSVCLIPEPVYVYFKNRPGSTMSSHAVRSAYDRVSVHQKLMEFMEKELDPSDYGWYRRFCLISLIAAYTRNEYIWGTAAFKQFAFRKGPYVWTQWRKAYPDTSFKNRVGRLFFFMRPSLHARLIGSSAS